MQYGEINFAYALWTIAALLGFAGYRLWRHKRQEQKFIPHVRYHAEARRGPSKARSGFFVCPDCGLLADQKSDCPECSDIKPTAMVPGDPNELESYLERQTIFYGSALE